MNITDFFESDKIDRIVQSQKNIMHPLIALISNTIDSTGNAQFVKYKFEIALKKIMQNDNIWYEKRKILFAV